MEEKKKNTLILAIMLPSLLATRLLFK
jgi:hypothetical protein